MHGASHLEIDMEYYAYDQALPARRSTPTEVPEIFIGGEWVKRNDPEKWDMNAVEITEARFNYLLATRKQA